MAQANIPPGGSMAMAIKRMERKRIESNTADPLLRYRLREQRLSEEFLEFGEAMRRQGEATSRYVPR